MSCHDCSVDEGMIHNFGCDMEMCPFCGSQLLSCGCEYKKLNIDCKPGSWAYEHGLTDDQCEQWITILESKRRVPYIIYPNMCVKCGVLWPNMFRVSNEEWEKYVPISERKKMICEQCYGIIKRLIDQGIKNA